MGLFDIFKRRKSTITTVIKEIYGGDVGLFARSYASRIYDIPEVRTAIECFADIFSSIPKYVERVDKDGNITYFETPTSRVLTLRANPLQNATQFWKDVITRLMLDNNVFVEPIFDLSTGELSQLYVLPRDSFKFELNGDAATVKFMSLGKTYDINSLIYLNRFATIAGGTSNNLGLYQTVIQALAQQAIDITNPKKVKALLTGKLGTSGNLKPEDKKGTLTDLKANFDANVNGIAYLDNQWAVTPINWQENDVNRDLMQFVINIVYNYFGITQEIINNKALEIEFQHFVKTRIRPIAQQAEQEFTSKLFTRREIEFGNRVEFDTFNLSVSTLQAKTALFGVGLRQGVMCIDDAREMIGLPPLPNGKGQMIRVTADTISIDKVDEYQAAQKGVKNNEIKEKDDGTKNKEN
jgi:HK97 family phage portal protein